MELIEDEGAATLRAVTAPVRAAYLAHNAALRHTDGLAIYDRTRRHDDRCYDVVFDAVGKSSFRQCKHLLKSKGTYLSTDLGPFRAIRRDALDKLAMADPDYGWTVEMQVRAAKRGLIATEVPVSYRRRIGRSKVSGTVRGAIGAGTKILYIIAREAIGR